MSRRTQVLDGFVPTNELTQDESNALAQANDCYVLQRAKEILCDLWKEGRIHINVRAEGDVALAAALHATENPEARGITQFQGEKLANEQWQREQERKDEEF